MSRIIDIVAAKLNYSNKHSFELYRTSVNTEDLLVNYFLRISSEETKKILEKVNYDLLKTNVRFVFPRYKTLMKNNQDITEKINPIGAKLVKTKNYNIKDLIDKDLEEFFYKEREEVFKIEKSNILMEKIHSLSTDYNDIIDGNYSLLNKRSKIKITFSFLYEECNSKNIKDLSAIQKNINKYI